MANKKKQYMERNKELNDKMNKGGANGSRCAMRNDINK